MKGKTTNEFLEYVNLQIRPMIIKDFSAIHRYASGIDMESYWQEIVLMIWKKAIVADEFPTIHNFTAWCFSYMKKYHSWTRESDFMRGTHSTKTEMLFNTYFMTDIQDEQLNRTIIRASHFKIQETPDIGLSRGWLTEALDRMTDLQRDAILCVKVCGMTWDDTAQQLNSTRSSIRSTIKKARKKIVDAAPPEYIPMYG